MELEDDQYLDNQDDDLLEEGDQLPNHDELDDNEGSERSGRGDLNVALRKEREQRRLLQDQLAQKDADLQRREALLQQLGQNHRREEPRVDRDAMRQAFSDNLLERPDEVFQQRDNQLRSEIMRQNAPLFIQAAKATIAEDPEFGDFYRNRPGFKKAADAYVQDYVTSYGPVEPTAMKHVLGLLSGIANDGQAPSNKAAKDRLSSIADKSGGASNRKSATQILEDKAKLSNRDYSKWAETPEGKRVLNEALKASG